MPDARTTPGYGAEPADGEAIVSSIPADLDDIATDPRSDAQPEGLSGAMPVAAIISSAA